MNNQLKQSTQDFLDLPPPEEMPVNIYISFRKLAEDLVRNWKAKDIASEKRKNQKPFYYLN